MSQELDVGVSLCDVGPTTCAVTFCHQGCTFLEVEVRLELETETSYCNVSCGHLNCQNKGLTHVRFLM